MSKDILGSLKSSTATVRSKDNSNSADSEDSNIVTKKPYHNFSITHPIFTSSKKRHNLKRWETEFE